MRDIFFVFSIVFFWVFSVEFGHVSPKREFLVVQNRVGFWRFPSDIKINVVCVSECVLLASLFIFVVMVFTKNI